MVGTAARRADTGTATGRTEYDVQHEYDSIYWCLLTRVARHSLGKDDLLEVGGQCHRKRDRHEVHWYNSVNFKGK